MENFPIVEQKRRLTTLVPSEGRIVQAVDGNCDTSTTSMKWRSTMGYKKARVVLAIIFILCLLLVAGCKSTNEEDNTNEVNSSESTIEIAPNDESVSVITTETSQQEATVETELTAIELTKLMGNGINLGNTMEAYGHSSLGTTAEISSYETLWGQPVTTKEMIQGMKEAGFDTLRIPVAWTNGMAFETGDYTIRKEYIDRVEEIVNYALESNMYVILNDHWDGGWWGMFGSATESTRLAAMDLYISMWTQIGERFKDYPDTLIFESANEELGDRLNDVTVAADSGTLNRDDCYRLTKEINQAFVDTIRSLGSNNSNRFLLIAGYNTDITATCDPRFIMPKDTATKKLLLSVHYYTPWNYCGTDSVTHWGTENNYNDQNELLKMMTKFSDQGYGIVFGEYSVIPMADGSIKGNTVEFLTNFLDNCDLYGYVPMLWDTNSYYKKEDLTIRDESIATLYKARSYASQSSLSDEEVKTQAQASMEAALQYAIENNTELDAIQITGDEDSVAWIMFNSNDYLITYSVGDVYDPSSKTDGVKARDAIITGPGTYTIGLDFTGTTEGFANNCAFSAIGISNGEILYPGYIITIKNIIINGNSYLLSGEPFTTTDDKKCTRMNLYNAWVGSIPPEARVAPDIDLTKVSPTVMTGIGHATKISITFDYGPAK